MNYVNQKEINGNVYIAYRDSKDPRKQFIVCGEKKVACRLSMVWNNNEAIINLFT